MNLAWGNLIIQASDADIPERGVNLSFVRTYNSQSQHDCTNDDGSTQGLFGTGWTNTLDAHIAYYNNDQTLSIYDGDGARYDYASNGAGGWTPPPGLQGTSIVAVSDGYEWFKKSGVSYYFKAPDYGVRFGSTLAGWDGRLRAIRGRNINNYVNIYYTWDNNDASTAAHINTIVAQHQDGQSLTLAFQDVAGCRELTSLTRPDGQIVNYHYSSQLLTEIDHPGNTITTTTSPTANQLPETYNYQTADRIVVEGPRMTLSSWATNNNPQDGSAVFFYLNSASVTQSIADDGNVNFIPADGTNTYLQPTMPVNRKVWRTKTFSYDSGVTGLVDTDGHETQWAMDGVGRETLKQRLNGSTWIQTTKQWDANNDLTEDTDPRGNATNYAYDANGNVIAIASPSVATSVGTFRPTSKYSYDSNNNIIAYCDPVATHAVGGDWVATPPSIDTLCPITTSGAETYSWAASSAEQDGELVSETSPTGYTTTFSYAPASEAGTDFGLPTSATGTSFSQVDGTVTSPSTTYVYDIRGNITAHNDGNGSWSEVFDSLNRQTSETDPDGVVVDSTSYNPDDTKASTQSAPQKALGYQSVFTYDADGNELTETHWFGCVSGASCTPGTTARWYDGFDRLVEVSEPAATTQSYYTSPWMTRYFYDLSQGGTVSVGTVSAGRAYGNMFKTQTDVASLNGLLGWGDTKGFGFDGLDRATMTVAHSGSWQEATNVYDATAVTVGELSSTTDAVGNTATYSYDTLGRRSAITYSGGLGNTPNQAWSYDPDGRVSSITSSVYGSESFTYDAAGDLISKTEPTGGGVTSPATLTYQFYPDSARESLSVASTSLSQQKLMAYSYRADGLPQDTTITFAGTTGKYSWTDTAAGRPSTMTDPFGTAYVYTYSAPQTTGLPTSKTIPVGAYSAIAYDAEGDIVSFAGYGAGSFKTVTFANGYNSRGELTISTNSEEPSVCWSGGGNPPPINNLVFPLHETESANGIPDSLPICTASSGSHTSFDGTSGQITGTYSWVPRGSSQTNSFGYDAAGRQVSQSETLSSGHFCNSSNPGGVDSGTGTISRTFDALDHIITQIDTSTQVSGSNMRSCLGTYSVGLVYGWGPDGQLATAGYTAANPYPKSTAPPLSTAQHVTLHWDGDQLLFVTNPNGSLGDIKFGDFAELLPQSTTIPGLTTIDRDLSGHYADRHSTSNLDAWFPQSPDDISPNAFAVPSGVDVQTPWILELTSDGYTDSWNQFQGVRSYDAASNSWTAADKYEGEAASPLSQRAYAYDNNNPVEYSDPSGYCSSKKATDPNCVGDKSVPRPIGGSKASCNCTHNPFVIVAGLLFDLFGGGATVETVRTDYGIPSSWRADWPKEGETLRFQDPKNVNNSVRFNLTSDKGSIYVRWLKNGHYMDKDGNVVSKTAGSGHIPLQDFNFNAGVYGP